MGRVGTVWRVCTWVSGSSCIVEDLVVKTFKIPLSPARAVQLSRLSVLVLTLFALAVSLRKANVFAQVFNAWSALGAGLGSALALSVLWKGTRKEAVAVGMVFGVLFVHLWPWIHGKVGWEYLSDPLAPGAIGSAVLIVAGSLAITWSKSRRKGTFAGETC